jgi:tRNA threonylcarbamoyladenosine biosynthesis protein TsaE
MRVGALLQAGDLIGLSGDLGSGKTTFVQGISAGWGSLDPVTSPTFVLVNVYRRNEDGARRLYHLDAYRLGSAAEAEELDLDAMLEDGPLVVEWADQIQAALPSEFLSISLSWIAEGQRDLLFAAHGRRYQDMLAFLRRQLFGVA